MAKSDSATAVTHPDRSDVGTVTSSTAAPEHCQTPRA